MCKLPSRKNTGLWRPVAERRMPKGLKEVILTKGRNGRKGERHVTYPRKCSAGAAAQSLQSILLLPYTTLHVHTDAWHTTRCMCICCKQWVGTSIGLQLPGQSSGASISGSGLQGQTRRRRSSCAQRVVCMRAVLQRVTKASVTVCGVDRRQSQETSSLSHGQLIMRLSRRSQVDGKVISSIGPGLLCLLGLGVGDTDADAEYM